MFSVQQCRKILGKKAKSMSDDQIKNLLNQMYGLAEVIVDIANEVGSNEKPKVIEPSQNKIHNGK